MNLIAYALRAELEGTVEIEIDGESQTVPKFGGAVLAVGDGDLHVRDTLDEGGGVICVKAADQTLVDLLDAYPALKRVGVPKDPAHVVSPYDRLVTDALRHVASLRDIAGAGSASRSKLIAALEAQDEALESGNRAAAAAVGATTVSAEETVDQLDDGTPSDEALEGAGQLEHKED